MAAKKGKVVRMKFDIHIYARGEGDVTGGACQVILQDVDPLFVDSATQTRIEQALIDARESAQHDDRLVRLTEHGTLD